ncbi:oligopeptidase B [Polymorphobacter multimanifer]|uniref:Oligopeptidase B n=1 Tax=Polymorphobacter multimanifer TaxID=1070431 RepID=A0A841LBM9_9SPHN|nr:oligopeptidase B [Polymorphobacter multimanifer]
MTLPPLAPQRSNVREYHGETLEDPWFWLKDPGYPNVTDPDVLGYLEAENRWFEAGMAPLRPLVDTLFEELKGRVTPDESSVPVRKGGHEYWWAFEPGAQYRQWWRRPAAENGGGGPDELILSEPALAEGKDYFRLAGISASPDGRLLAYAFDDNGSERFTLKVRDLASGADVATVATTSIGVPVWTADSTALAWTEVNENWRSFRVALHRLGGGDDITLYEESDPGFSVGVDKSQDGKWLIIAAGDKVTSEVRLLPAGDPLAPPRLVRARQVGLEYDVDVRGDTLFVRANDTHPNFRVATASVAGPPEALGEWTTLIEGSDTDYIQGISAFTSFLAVSGREAGLDQVWLHFGDGRTQRIAFPEASYSARIGDNREPDAPLLRLGYSSMVTPSSVFDYEVATAMLHIRKVQQVASGYDANLYATERLMIAARDGVLVPVSLVYRKDWDRQRLHLYGYGAYGIAIPPGFSASRLSLLDRGLGYAIAHVRGGDDLGHQWYLDGKLEKRANAFTDFIDVARGLVALGYAAPGQISASGGSAGGELMGVVINDAPELWAAVVADVPFVDVLNTMLDDSLPLTPGEWPEWGNPIIDKAAYDLIRSYSPYDQVKRQDYPPLLVTAGLNDPRVTYWEPAKWVAKLRTRKTDANPLYLKTNMGAGHGGKSGRFAALEETAEEFAFILKAFGLA